MYLQTLTIGHTIISLVAIAMGLAVLVRWVAGQSAAPGHLAVFIATAWITSLTGYLFPFNGVLPSHIVGVVALAVLAAVYVADRVRRRAGLWNGVYVIGIVTSVYLLVFVLVAQLFLKVPALSRLAPTGTEPAFGLAQGLVFIAFAIAGFLAVRRLPTSGRSLPA